jgi:hypothetical protein
MEDIGQRVHEARFTDARNALEQDVATSQQACDRIGHQFLVPDDTPPDFFGDSNEVFLKVIDVLFNRCGHWRRKK